MGRSASMSRNNSALTIIEAFKLADAELRLAIDRGNDDEIRRASKTVDEMIEELLEMECTSRIETKVLLQFLIEQFLLTESGGNCLQRRICNKVLKAF